MPEIKHTFTGGKMNKDLDERLIPNGQYRDAMNIQVSTSEGSDVGTVQNILGNEFITNNLHNFAGELPPEAVSIASIADEKVDTLYWFVWSPVCDYIFSYKRNATSVETIFRDMNKDTLKFDPRDVITGINIIDDLLFWTDNRSEPKKINIPRCKAGTPANSNAHTKLINDANGITIASNIDIEEKHITVIKRTPLKALKMNLVSTREPNKNYTAVLETTTSGFNFGTIGTDEDNNTLIIQMGGGTAGTGILTSILNTSGQEFLIDNINVVDIIGDELKGMTGWQNGTPNGTSPNLIQNNIPVGTRLVFKEFNEDGTPPSLPITDYTLKGRVIDSKPDNPNQVNFRDAVTIAIDSIVGIPRIPTTAGETIRYAVDLFDETEKLFEFKFPRFSYRYKYEDGEYSPFAPFTQIAFSPGAFDYHPRKGYNIGMTNKIKEIELSDFIYNNMPNDVVSVDVLFKEEVSPNIYVVDTLRPDDEILPGSGGVNDWNNVRNGGFYKIRKETINSVVPSNQLLRPWDNVPRKALAQDVSGNRIIYGNYVQNYDLKTSLNENFIASFDANWNTFPGTAAGSNKSIKSLREYQLGVVFLDKYGRETPVISSESGTINLEKNRSSLNNRVSVALLGKAPEKLTHFKFFIKETAGEYYNMAMDRWYDAEDNNIWLAFPSSDRNKIDIDTFLILKKAADSDNLVTEPARYKVLAIENEAPDFVKTTKRIASTKTHFTLNASKPIFITGTTNMPFTGSSEFNVLYKEYYGTSGQTLDLIENDIYVEFAMIGSEQVSKRYRVASLTNTYNPFSADVANHDKNTAVYSFRLDEPLGDDVNFINNDLSGSNGSSIRDLAVLNVYEYKVENRPQFDGRFFVKIYYDDIFKNNVADITRKKVEYNVRDTRKIYSMNNNAVDAHTKDHGRFLTTLSSGQGTPASFSGSDLHLAVPFYNDRLETESMNYGYYRVDRFAAMAMYFRRYINTNNYSGQSTSQAPNIPSNGFPVRILAHLKPVNTGGLQYKTGGKVQPERWKAQDDWDQEFGVRWLIGSSAPLGYTGWHGVNTILPNKTERAKNANNLISSISYYFNTSGDNLTWAENIPTGNGYTANWKMFADTPSGGGFAESSGYNTSLLDNNIIHAKSQNRGNAENARDTEVWFIDSGPYVGYIGGGNDLDFLGNLGTGSKATQVLGGNQKYPVNYGAGIQAGSISWNMDLAFGGIQTKRMEHGRSDNTGTQRTDYWKGVFNIGQWNADPADSSNEFYLDSQTKEFVKRINPGTQFRFKEDPNQTVYTMSGDVFGGAGSGNLLRHSTVVTKINDDEKNQINISPSKRTVMQEFNYFVKGHNYDNDQATLTAYQQGGSWGHWAMAEEIGFNLTKRWRATGIEPAIEWNPMQNGQITGGIDIKIKSCNDYGTTALSTTSNGQNVVGGDILKIYVKSLLGNANSANKENSVLQVGMALKSYTDSTSGSEELLQTHLGSTANEYLVVYHIEERTVSGNTFFALSLGGYKTATHTTIEHIPLTTTKSPKVDTNYRFVQVGMNGFSDNSEFNFNTMAYYVGNGAYGKIGAVGYTLEFLEKAETEGVLSENPAIWETEPKETKGLDIYYEASRGMPINIDSSNIHHAIPIRSTVGGYEVIGHNGDNLVFNTLDTAFVGLAFSPGILNKLEIITPDGLKFYERMDLTWWFDLAATDALRATAIIATQEIKINPDLFNSVFHLTWHNCFAFGNGVESNRIRDNFNLPFITNGVKASTTLEQEYKEEHRKYGLIYSGLYNSISGINNLNQFIQAEKITKDINPIYGSIQKLHSRDTDLVTLCEDKCLRILANKDAVFNADGNPNLTATENVLGQTVPFSGEYGISTNPESFASENYRVYFADKTRGTVLRLSKDGLTPISEHGMKDWFRDNLKLSNKLIGSYDDKKEQYNLTLKNIFYTTDKIGVVTGSTGSSAAVSAEIGYEGMTAASSSFSTPPPPPVAKPPAPTGETGSGSASSGSGGGGGGGAGGY
tara:strand:+ start:785 stop:6748 length:5964 start_codon:yes stop_codon:yes gene_type:complete